MQGPASTTVTGTTRPCSSKICVMPTFRPRIDFTIALGPAERFSARPGFRTEIPDEQRTFQLKLDLDIDAAGQVEPHEGVDRLRPGIEDVDEPLVRAHLEVLHRLLVDVRPAVHAEDVLLGRQRHGPGDPGARAAGSLHDLA